MERRVVVCPECGGESTSRTDEGLLVCDDCGTVLNHGEEMGEDDDILNGQSVNMANSGLKSTRRGLNVSTQHDFRQRQAQAREAKLAAQKPLAWDDTISWYQEYLSAVTNVLIRQYAVTPEVRSIVGPLFHRYVAVSIFNSRNGKRLAWRFHNDGGARASGEGKEEHDGMRTQDEQEVQRAEADAREGNMDDGDTGAEPGQSSRPIPRSRKKTAGNLKASTGLLVTGVNLHPMVTLVLCYLACVFLRQAITTKDLADWAKGDGSGLWAEASGAWGAESAGGRASAGAHAASVRAGEGSLCKVYFGWWKTQSWDERPVPSRLGACVRPRKAPSAGHLNVMAKQISQMLNLQLPPINFELLVARYCRELRADVTALPLALRLHALFKSDGLSIDRVTFRAHGGALGTNAPPVHVIAYLVSPAPRALALLSHRARSLSLSHPVAPALSHFSLWFSFSLSVCLSLSLSACVVRAHTHNRTHRFWR
jgi:hypothetical protein